MERQGGSRGLAEDQAVLRVLDRRGAKEQAPPHDGGEAFAEELVVFIVCCFQHIVKFRVLRLKVLRFP